MSGWIFDDRDGRIRPLTDDDPQTAHDAAARATGVMLMARPVVYADGKIMGELMQVSEPTAPVVVVRENGVHVVTLDMPSRLT